MVVLALLLWPVIIFVMFKRLSPAVALCVAIMGGYLLLPVGSGWDFPLIPALDKESITNLATLAAALIITAQVRLQPQGQSLVRPGWIPRSKTGFGLATILVLGSLLTAIANSDPIVFETSSLPGLSFYDGISNALSAFISLLPLILARKFLAYPETQKTLLIVFVIAGFLYSLLALYEVRFSPQLNRNVYGFFPHDWIQHVRAGGFRPIVFLQHGLWLGIFFCMATIASAALVRIDRSRRTKYMLIVIWLFITLLLSKTLGAFAIACLLVPCVLLMPVGVQLLAAVTISSIVLLYPTLRGAGLVPTDTIISVLEQYNPERAGSLAFRFDNEQILLDKANERPLLGWGTFGRNRVYDDAGVDQSVTDGGWIIAIGSGGWVRYFSEMGLMALPIIFLAMNRRRYNIDAATAGLSMVLTANMIDQIPNGTLTPITWLVAGALLGRLELGRVSTDMPAVAEPAPATRSPYTRQSQILTRK